MFLKRQTLTIAAVAAVLAAVAFIVICDRQEPTAPEGPGAVVPDAFARKGYTAPPAKETTPTWRRLLPGFKPNEADRELEGLPPGTQKLVGETPSGERVEVVVTPAGEILLGPQSGLTKARVLRRPFPWAAGTFRPWVGAAAIFPAASGARGGAAIGVDLLRLSRERPVRIGVGAAVDTDIKPGAVARVAWTPYKNLDVWGGLCYRPDGLGWAFGGSVGIGK